MWAFLQVEWPIKSALWLTVHSILEKLLVPQLVTKYLTFYTGSQGLLVCLQGSATFNPEPEASSPHPAFKISLIIIFPFMPCL